MRLDGRRVLVVGASRGIGRAIGMACNREGASVAFAARTKEKLDAAAAECQGKAIAVECDVREERSCRAAVATVVEAFGGLDALVYSTGMSRFMMIADARYDNWREVFETNVMGAAIVTAAAIDHLKVSRGHAIYLGSESATYRPDPWPGIGLYIASKVALDSMVRSLHVEVPEVAVTNYVVGQTVTEFGSDDAEALAPFVTDWVERGYVKDRLLDPETHGRAVVEILTSDAWIERVSVRVR